MGDRVFLACQICGGRMAGSSLVDLSSEGDRAGVYLMHLVDEHWELLERLRATTGDPAARMALNAQLRSEFSRFT